MRVGKNLGTVESFTDIADIALNGDTCYKDKVEYKLVCNYWTEASKLDEKELISAHPTLDARCFGTVTQLPQSEVKDGDTCFYAGAWFELYNGYWELQEYVKEMPFKIKPAEEAIVSTGLEKGMAETTQKYKSEARNALKSALETQIGGDHYKSCAIQPVEFIVKNEIKFLPGCAIKRLTRYNKPTGKGLQDLQKAIHEIQLMIELEYPESVCKK